jgi:hypothetical protein
LQKWRREQAKEYPFRLCGVYKAAAERNELLRSAFIAEIGTGYMPNNSFSLMKAPKMNVLFHADTDIHM